MNGGVNPGLQVKVSISMSSTMILFLQSLLITLQMVNAGLATIPNIPVVVPLVASAVIGGFQYFIQHLGNLSVPPQVHGDAETDGAPDVPTVPPTIVLTEKGGSAGK